MFVVRKRLLTFSLHDQDYKETRTGKDANSTALFTKTQHWLQVLDYDLTVY